MAHSPEVTLFVAAAGYGKSTALEAAKPRDGVVRPARIVLVDGVPARDWLGIDDLHELTDQEQVLLLDALADLPGGTRVTAASRRPLAQAVRARLRGRIRDRGAADLALTPYDVHRVLADEYGMPDPELPVEVHALTAGWPALVHHAAAALARDPGADLNEVLTAAHFPARQWLLDEVVGDLSPDAKDALAVVAGRGGVTEDVLGRPTADLETLGVVVRLPGVGREGLLDPVPALAGCLPAPSASAARAVVPRLEAAGLPYGAARAAAEAGDLPEALRLVAEQGNAMLRSAHHTGLVDLVAAAPPELVTPAVQQVNGEALRLTGDLTAAARALRPLTTDDGDRPTGLATRVAAIHYAAGRYETALDVLHHGQPSTDAGQEHVESLALRVHVLCSLGRTDEAAAPARQALDLADATGEPAAGATAHAAMARVSTGARKEAHHEAALQAAAAARDVVTAARVLVNHAFHLLAAARYGEACQAARAALQAADAGSGTGRRASALHNLAEALSYLGEYDEARWHLARAVALCRRLGAGRTALGLLGLAEIDRATGHDERALPRYLEAVELARETGETQVLVPALAGLARTDALSDLPEHRERAHTAADEALELASGGLRPVALTAAGRVSLAAGDLSRARAHAQAAAVAARESDALDLLAEALELEAACTGRPDEARTLLARALSIWSAGGARPQAARVELALGSLEDADAIARSRARDAARDLQRLGVLHVNAAPISSPVAANQVEIAVLGGFRVRTDGAEVPVPAWRSRQARTLVKILAARRGRPASRAWLCETLWPDDDPAKTGHRLSVLLASVRGVLDAERRWPSDHYVAADLDGIRLDLRHVALDAETLIRDAEAAAALMDDGEEDRAREILADIDRRYAGDALEDEPGQEWADGLREEARAAWQRSVRRLAVLARRAGRSGDAQTLLVRLLTADPYDEPAHLQLVRSLLRTGRRGEARRAFARWQRAMADIGAPLPDPRVLDAAAEPRRPARPTVRATRGRPVVTSY